LASARLLEVARKTTGLGFTKTDEDWAIALGAALVAMRRDDLQHGTNAAYVADASAKECREHQQRGWAGTSNPDSGNQLEVFGRFDVARLVFHPDIGEVLPFDSQNLFDKSSDDAADLDQGAAIIVESSATLQIKQGEFLQITGHLMEEDDTFGGVNDFLGSIDMRFPFNALPNGLVQLPIFQESDQIVSVKMSAKWWGRGRGFHPLTAGVVTARWRAREARTRARTRRARVIRATSDSPASSSGSAALNRLRDGMIAVVVAVVAVPHKTTS
jgi:hypothetical protein